MKTLKILLAALPLAIAPAVAAGPSKPAEKPKIEFKVTPDAGVSVPEAVKPVDPTERRDQLRVFATVMQQAIADQLKVPVGVKSIMFAEQFTEKADAAIVTFTANGKDTSNVFIYSNGKWQVFPADFSEPAAK
jgi:hypothetical protein